MKKCGKAPYGKPVVLTEAMWNVLTRMIAGMSSGTWLTTLRWFGSTRNRCANHLQSTLTGKVVKACRNCPDQRQKNRRSRVTGYSLTCQQVGQLPV